MGPLDYRSVPPSLLPSTFRLSLFREDWEGDFDFSYSPTGDHLDSGSSWGLYDSLESV